MKNNKPDSFRLILNILAVLIGVYCKLHELTVIFGVILLLTSENGILVIEPYVKQMNKWFVRRSSWQVFLIVAITQVTHAFMMLILIGCGVVLVLHAETLKGVAVIVGGLYMLWYLEWLLNSILMNSGFYKILITKN